MWKRQVPQICHIQHHRRVIICIDEISTTWPSASRRVPYSLSLRYYITDSRTITMDLCTNKSNSKNQNQNQNLNKRHWSQQDYNSHSYHIQLTNILSYRYIPTDRQSSMHQYHRYHVFIKIKMKIIYLPAIVWSPGIDAAISKHALPSSWMELRFTLGWRVGAIDGMESTKIVNTFY